MRVDQELVGKGLSLSGLESGEFRARGVPRIKSVLEAVPFKCSLQGCFMAKKGIAEAGHPWEDQGKVSFSPKAEALFADSLKKSSLSREYFYLSPFLLSETVNVTLPRKIFRELP